ncbi:HNH endonuclease [Pseudomonas luteola]
MSINFAAAHTRNPWRHHKRHETLSAAIDGKDGARKLLLRIGRIKDMWDKYGTVRAVFVWKDGSPTGFVLRLSPGKDSCVEMAEVTTDRILRIHRQQSCSNADIQGIFIEQCLSDITPVNAATEASGISSAVNEQSPFYTYPDELSEGVEYIEGLSKQSVVNRYERSIGARNACLAHHGYKCAACTFDFESVYGVIGRDFIHVHHVVPLASIGRNYQIDPLNDLVPVCPNCHAMLHRMDPPMSVEQLRALLTKSRPL